MEKSLFDALCLDCQALCKSAGEGPEDEKMDTKKPAKNFDEAHERGMNRIMIAFGKGKKPGAKDEAVESDEE